MWSACQATFEVGDVAWFGQLRGIVRYVGKTQFAEGVWFGIELDEKAARSYLRTCTGYPSAREARKGKMTAP
ncbi:unnamed protein product [Durusdinium trenchii]|uniref:CAP-Gly domain-containing protein n=1 Tax=Durusdinium trenchii TaxID=1381693 RepID=A0ABP0QPA8_9DINO